MVKFCESLGQVTCRWIDENLKGKLPERDIKRMTDDLVLKTNIADAIGGGPLWAVNGIACVSHGRSMHPEIAKAIGQAKFAFEHDILGALKEELASARSRLNSTDK